MKKSLFFCVAVLALTSCSKNEVTDSAVAPVNSNVIGFNTSTGSTRAADFTSATDLQSGFNVIGMDQGGTALFDAETADVSNKFLYKTDKWSWEFETEDKKWPAVSSKYPLTFYSAFPFVATSSLNATTTTATIVIDETDISNNNDMLAARTMVANKPISGVVALNFKHILSKIAFQIVSPVGYKVYIQSLTIKNVAKAGGTYDYKAGSYSVTPDAGSTKANFVHVTSTIPTALTGLGDAADKGVAVKSGNGTSDDTWKLMPQNSTSSWSKAAFAAAAKAHTGDWADFLTANTAIFDGAMIEVVYRMEDADGKSIVGWKTGETMADGATAADKNCYVKVAFPLDIINQANKGTTDKGWLKANSYTYQIKFGTADATNGTVIDPNYKGDGGTDTNLPIDNPTVKPGEDIISNERCIGFNVLVDVWTDNSNEIK